MDFKTLALLLSGAGGFLTGAVAIVVAYLNSRNERADEELDTRKMNFDELTQLYVSVKAERDELRERCAHLEAELRGWRT